MHEDDRNCRWFLGESRSAKTGEGEGGGSLEKATAVQHWAFSLDLAFGLAATIRDRREAANPWTLDFDNRPSCKKKGVGTHPR